MFDETNKVGNETEKNIVIFFRVTVCYRALTNAKHLFSCKTLSKDIC